MKRDAQFYHQRWIDGLAHKVREALALAQLGGEINLLNFTDFIESGYIDSAVEDSISEAEEGIVNETITHIEQYYDDWVQEQDRDRAIERKREEEQEKLMQRDREQRTSKLSFNWS